METFSALLAICAGNSPIPSEFPAKRPVTHSFDFFFDLRPNKRLNKQSWGWLFETLLRPLWRQCNGRAVLLVKNTCELPHLWPNIVIQGCHVIFVIYRWHTDKRPWLFWNTNRFANETLDMTAVIESQDRCHMCKLFYWWYFLYVIQLEMQNR